MRKEVNKAKKPLYHQLRYRILGLDYTVDLGELSPGEEDKTESPHILHVHQFYTTLPLQVQRFVKFYMDDIKIHYCQVFRDETSKNLNRFAMDEFKVENIDLIKEEGDNLSKKKMQFSFNKSKVNPKFYDKMEVDCSFGIQLAPQ